MQQKRKTAIASLICLIANRLPWLVLGAHLAYLTSGVAQAAQPICDLATAGSNQDGAPPTIAWAMRRHLSLLDVIRKHHDVIMIGDSITQLWPDELLKGIFQGEDVVNFGVGGDGTQQVLWRIRNSDVTQTNPKDEYVLIGTNDLGSGNPCSIVVGVHAIYDIALSKWPLSYFHIVGLLPRGISPTSSPQVIDSVNDNLKRLASALPRADYIDPPPELRCIYTDTACALYAPDRLHLARLGYEALAQAIQRSKQPKPR